MEKAYHPCYTNLNPVADARRYTTETVHFRTVTLVYDWLDPERSVESWFRRVPYRLERDLEGSWVVKYFEFRAGISPISQAGFIGDLWISWSARDPSVWFKVDEVTWERWGGCTSSIHEVSFIRAHSLFLPSVFSLVIQTVLLPSRFASPGLWVFSIPFLGEQRMDAKHPFLDKAYLWFDPKDYFFLDELPDGRPKLRWERPQSIRRVAPVSRIIDPDCSSPLKKIPTNPVHLPSMRTIVRAMCPHMPQITTGPRHPPKVGVDDQEEDLDWAMAVDAGMDRVEDPQGDRKSVV